jgi:DNA uptake protein ComE-like DNA-binding protein
MKKEKGISESFMIGVIALAFLLIGYQTALFIHRATVLKIAQVRDEPDTVYVYRGGGDEISVQKKNGYHEPRAEAVRQNLPRRRVESFRFDPNTVSVEDLCRLGFTMKQAQSIDNYRKKGGKFRRKGDFAKSYVVADSVFKRLEKFIDIPLVDLNLADSAAFDALPGIGGWFASKMIEHRKALGGYSYKEQLMDIYRFDQEKYDALSDLVTVSADNVTPYPLWTYPVDSLRMHPYIGNYETARAIVLFRENTPRSEWTVEKISAAGILDDSAAEKLSGCSIAEP